jgi:hypothetical protein
MIELAVILILAGLIVWLERSHRLEGAAWRLERASLLQRIQAPERAIVAHEIPDMAVNPPAVNSFDDADHWDEQRRMMAEIERMERGPWAS